MGVYWNKTRSTADSGGSSIPCMISITNIFQLTDRITAHHTSSCHTGHTRLTRNWGQARVYPRPRLSRLPSGMHEKLTRMITITSISISNSKESHYALTRMIVSSHKITNAPCQGGVVTVSTNTQKYYARVQNACLQGVEG